MSPLNVVLFLSMVAVLKQTDQFLADAEDVLDGYYDERRRTLHRKVRRVLNPAGRYNGATISRLPDIRDLIEKTGSNTLLEYGSDSIYNRPAVLEYLGVDFIACYNPGVHEHSEVPAGQFDGVFSLDVLTHISESDIPWIVDEMFSKARSFVFATVTSVKTDWWMDIVESCAADHPGVLYDFRVTADRRRRWLPFRRQPDVRFIISNAA